MKDSENNYIKTNKIPGYNELVESMETVAQEETSQEILTAVENIDIDTSDLAKQGNDSGATNTAIYIGTNDIKDILNSGKILVEITSSEIDDMIDRIIGDDIQ